MRRILLTALALILAGAFAASPQTNTFCSSSLPCAVSALWNFTGGLQASGVNVADVSSAQTLANKTENITSNPHVENTPTAGLYLRDNGTSFQPSAVAAAGAVTCAAHKWASTLSDNSASTCTQPAFSDVTGTASTSQIGTGTPAASKYVDGATGAWTILPANAVNGASQTSAATNVGTALGTQTIVASVSSTGPVFLIVQPVVNSGTGCTGSAPNPAIPTVSYTSPLFGATTQVGNAAGVPTAGSAVSNGSNANIFQIVAQSGTAITYTTTSSFGSLSGCSVTPQYTVYAKAIF